MRLDRLLAEAIGAFDAAQGGPVVERFRGLVIGPEEPRRLLARMPGSPAFFVEDDDGAPLWPAATGTLAHRLASAFDLSPLDLDILLIAFAPEFDLRYERIYGYLQDDVTRKRPTIDFVLNLLCAGESDRWSRLSAFERDAPLLRHHVISLADDPQRAGSPRLARYVVPADDTIAILSGQTEVPERATSARTQSSAALAAIATRIVPRAAWDDIVLPLDAVAQLRELCQRVDQRARVFGEWGFGRTMSRGRGITALFSGGSGTGKTMAAEVVANALGLDLYRIDLARIVSKYIGETEKNLDRVFTAAQSAGAILFFDEADALFGKRSDVKDAHDRYANLEVSYLLQKMEEYEGLAILATNLAEHLDQAFTRRLAAHIYFPFPDAAARLEIWKRAWPREVPLAGDIDLSAIARELKVAGGNIHNIALAAAFSAAANGGIVSRAHVFHAVRREHQKAGRASELAPAFSESAIHALAAVER
jgi:AAA+ superfamily predicted ATPase